MTTPPITYVPQDPASKKKKLYPPFRPAQFWDNLTEIPLTSSALRELDSRNTGISEDAASDPQLCLRRGRSRKTNRLENAAEILSRLSPTSLRDVRRLARQGGAYLQDLRTWPQMGSNQYLGRRKRGRRPPQKKGLQPSRESSTEAPTSSATTGTRSKRPYDRAFGQHLIDHDIFPSHYEYPDGTAPPAAENIDKIRRTLSQSRRSLRPSKFTKEDFQKFARADEHASKELDVTSSVIPIIEGDVGDRKCTTGGLRFVNLDYLTDGTIVAGNPDRYYGARPGQLKQPIREELEGRIMPTTQHDLPIAPNFFLQAKGPEGTSSVARRQACYDGALGARGMHSLREYASATTNPPLDNQAYTLTSTYQGGTLTMYASHPILPTELGGSPGYALTMLDAFAMTGNDENFRKGAAAYRNGRDWAKQQRDNAIRQANEAWNQRHVTANVLDNGVLNPVSDGSTGETMPVSSTGESMATTQSTVVPELELRTNPVGSVDDAVDDSVDE